MSKKIITLTINEKDIRFEPNITAYNSMINDMSMDNKIAPITTYLKRIVCAESKEYLDELLTLPGTAAQIVDNVNKAYAPRLEISIKKLTHRVRAIEKNPLQQFRILRQRYLPHEADTEENLAAAIWLDNRYSENMRIAIANGIALAFKGGS